MDFQNWWTLNLGKHKGYHYDDVRYGYEARDTDIAILKDQNNKLKELLKELADSCLASSIDPSVNYSRQMYRKELHGTAYKLLKEIKDYERSNI
jgi:hypothetical protein